MYDRLKTVTQSDIEHLNAELKISIPKIYSDFLIANGGGQPTLNVFRRLDESGEPSMEISINVFLGINEDLSVDIAYAYTVFSDRIPSELLPIAYDGIGNVFCIGVGSDNNGKIYIWYDQERDLDEPASYKDVRFVATDLNEFLRCLACEDD